MEVFVKYLWSTKDTRLGWGEGWREQRNLLVYIGKGLGMVLHESGKVVEEVGF